MPQPDSSADRAEYENNLASMVDRSGRMLRNGSLLRLHGDLYRVEQLELGEVYLQDVRTGKHSWMLMADVLGGIRHDQQSARHDGQQGSTA